MRGLFRRVGAFTPPGGAIRPPARGALIALASIGVSVLAGTSSPTPVPPPGISPAAVWPAARQPGRRPAGNRRGASFTQRDQGSRPNYHADVTAPQHDAFGFRLGEQRRYARGPERIFSAGEFEIWTMRLDEIDSSRNGMPLYTFTYSREVSLANRRDPGSTDSFRATMSMTVNHYGFPVEIRYGGDSLEESAVDFVNKHGRLTWIGSAYLFRAPEVGEDFSINFELPEHDGFNPGIPSGLFVSETENPALITIPAAIFQALGVTEMEYLSLRPNRIGRQQVRRPRLPGDSRRRGDVVRGKLEFEGTETIEVGERDYEAIKLESSDSGRDLYIRNDGALLLMEVRFRNWNGHIRLLHPSEY